MSKSKFDSDGFQIVKRSGKSKTSKLHQYCLKVGKNNIEISIRDSQRKIFSCEEAVERSVYLENVIKIVSKVLRSRKIVDIICFGLGHVGECYVSQYQLALLLCIKKAFSPINIYVHDPILYTSECTLLKSLDLTVLENNSEGKYKISDEGVTLAYLPHCPKQLTNNFLWSNWGLNLQNCILLCNSFASLVENQPSQVLKDTVLYIFQISKLTSEINLPNTFDHKNIFNDISCHYFTKDILTSVQSDFWTNKIKPHYKNNEEFITSLMIDKLTLA